MEASTGWKKKTFLIAINAGFILLTPISSFFPSRIFFFSWNVNYRKRHLWGFVFSKELPKNKEEILDSLPFLSDFSPFKCWICLREEEFLLKFHKANGTRRESERRQEHNLFLITIRRVSEMCLHEMTVKDEEWCSKQMKMWFLHANQSSTPSPYINPPRHPHVVGQTTKREYF